MDCEETCTELQTLSITQRISLSEDSLKNESRFKDNIHVRSEDMFVETEDSYNTNTAAFSGFDVTLITKEPLDSSNPSQTTVSHLT